MFYEMKYSPPTRLVCFLFYGVSLVFLNTSGDLCLSPSLIYRVVENKGGGKAQGGGEEKGMELR